MLRRPQNNDPASRASRFRRQRFRMIESLISEAAQRDGPITILDVGGKRGYWNLLSENLQGSVRITILNLEAETDIGRVPADRDPLDVRYDVGDGCNMPQFGDASFDIVHSNSVIEHVGSLSNMVRLANEIRRVGKAYYVQTPYLWFPIEPHYGVPFVHWLPAPSRAQMLNRFKLGYANRVADYPDALSSADHTQLVDKTLMRRLFPDSELTNERYFLMTKSLIMIRRHPFAKQG